MNTVASSGGASISRSPSGSSRGMSVSRPGSRCLSRGGVLRDHRLATIHAIQSDQSELRRSTAGKLERTGAAQLSTASGMISACLTRFRWGDT